MDVNGLRALSKVEIPQLAKNLALKDIGFLIECLAEKDENIRYPAFLLLQASSREFPFVYRYWDVLESKLGSDNSYQRSSGLKLISENLRWDKDGKFAKTLNKYLSCCADEKFITARQAIQGLANIITATSAYNDEIKRNLTNLPLGKYKASQQKLLRKDVSSIIEVIDKK
jgi:hypothetical protein